MAEDWTPSVSHTELERVEGGWVYRTEAGWWAHPESIKHGYSWGPYIGKDVAVGALRRGQA